MKVAIIHDWLVTYAGAERVLEQMLLCFPTADLFSVVDTLASGDREFILNKSVTTSFIQKLPFSRTRYRAYLPLMPLAIEQFDMSGYDIVISSSHAVAKGVITGPDQLHICMCYSPIRYAWDLQHEYLREAGLSRGLRGWLAKLILHKIRIWDARTANGVDDFIAISRFISRRIWKAYRRETTVIYPPVDVDLFTPGGSRDDFYLTVSRLVPYKRVDLIVEAFSSMPNRRLVVIGDGPELQKIKAKAGANTTILGHQPIEVVRDYLRRARAFVFAAAEDFGIAPIEAQACGTPVVAYGYGGAQETIVAPSNMSSEDDTAGTQPPFTGVFFGEQTVSALAAAVQHFELISRDISEGACRENASRFSAPRFRAEFSAYVDRKWDAFRASQKLG